MPGNHPKKQRLYNVLFRMVWGNISKIFQKHFKPTNLIQQIKNLLIYQRKYDRLYHVKVITYFHARVAQGWSTTLPRWGPRVRIPSRAFNFARFYRAFFVSCCISCCMAFSKTLYQPSGLRSLRSFMRSSGDRFSLSFREGFSGFTMLSK